MTTATNKRNKIDLISHGVKAERVASAAFKPGHILIHNTDGTVKKHDAAGGKALLCFALQQDLQGYVGSTDPKNLMSAYAADDPVTVVFPLRGDLMVGRVAAAAPAITYSDFLVSDGAGGLKKPTSLGTHTLFAAVAASTAVSNTVTTEQDFDATYSIPANTLQAGDILTIKGHAVVSAAAGTDTLTVKVYIGSVAIAATAAVNATTGDIVEWELTVVVRTAGASGTMVAFGFVANGVVGTATALPIHMASTTLDTTAAKTVKVTSTWSATTATCTAAVEALNVELSRVAPQDLLVMAEESVDNSAGSDDALIKVRVL